MILPNGITAAWVIPGAASGWVMPLSLRPTFPLLDMIIGHHQLGRYTEVARYDNGRFV